MMASLFTLPSELVITSILSALPCREQQVRSLAILLSSQGAACRNIVIHGLEATGKTSVVKAVLDAHSPPNAQFGKEDAEHDSLQYAIVKSAECISGRHLLEQTVGGIAKALKFEGTVGRCENLASLAVEVARLLQNGWAERGSKRFVLVFDGIDHQRDAPPTLLPALARLGELIPSLTIIFIVTHPRPHFLHSPGVPHIHFPAYTKPELIQILTKSTPSPLLPEPISLATTNETWTRFTSAVYDSFSKHCGRDIISFRSVCLRLWPSFIMPIVEGTHSATPFSRLLLANRSLFQKDSVLVPNIVADKPAGDATKSGSKKYQGVGAQLPYYSRLLLVAAYYASFNPPKTDQLFFMKTAASKRRKKGGGTALSRGRPGVTKHRKISRRLLGPQAFVLERMIAIFHALKVDAGKRKEAINGSADIQMAIATLASLRLLVKVGSLNAGDGLDAGVKYRIAVGWEVIRGIARTVGIEADDYLVE